MNALGYIRISTKDQSHFSLEYQERHVRAYCETNNLTLLDLFTDDGESSYTFDRPDFKRLEAFIKKNKNVQYLIIFDHDRFSRNLAEALIKIKELHDKYDVKVLATTDSIDTDYSDPSAFLMRSFKYMMAESELHRIRARVKQGIRQALMSGRYIHQAPYGYILARDSSGKSMIVIDTEKITNVQYVFKQFLNGVSHESIRQEMKIRGWIIKGNSGIVKIVSNPVYGGLIKVPADKKNPEQMVRGIHTGLVPESDYWKAIEIINGGKTGKVPQASEEVFLRGVLTCQCGRKLTAGRSKGKNKHYWYYECKDHRRGLSAVKLHKQFKQILDALSFDDSTIQTVESMFKKSWSKMNEGKADRIKELEKKIADLDKKIYAAEERYLTSDQMNPDTFKKVVARLKVEKGLGEDEHRKYSSLLSTNAELLKQLSSIKPMLTSLSKFFDTLSLSKKQAFITLVFGKNLWHDGEIYRTPHIYQMFSHNRLKLKELGLLELTHKIDSSVLTTSVESRGELPNTEQLQELIRIFAA